MKNQIHCYSPILLKTYLLLCLCFLASNAAMGQDSDGDGILDSMDNCPTVANANQANFDGDLFGDKCDPDMDNDGASNAEDCAPKNAAIFPGAIEICNNRDEDCDGMIDDNVPPVAVVVSIAKSSCVDTPDGIIDIRVVRCGPAPYTFLWSNGATSEDLTAAPGTYSVVVTDAEGQTTSLSASIPAPPPLTVSITNKRSPCEGENTGFVRAKALGGTGVKTYLWSNGSTSDLASNLSAATFPTGTIYSVVATDSKGCTADASQILYPIWAALLTIEPDPAKPGNYVGEMLSYTGTGNAPYKYRQCDINSSNCSAWQNSPILTNIPPGFRTFQARDNTGCIWAGSFFVGGTKPAPMQSQNIDFQQIETLAAERGKTADVEFRLAPNPFEQQLRLSRAGDFSEKFLVKMYDASGRIVAERNWAADAEWLDMEIAPLPAGIFSIQILDENGGQRQVLRAVKSN